MFFSFLASPRLASNPHCLFGLCQEKVAFLGQSLHSHGYYSTTLYSAHLELYNAQSTLQQCNVTWFLSSEPYLWFQQLKYTDIPIEHWTCMSLHWMYIYYLHMCWILSSAFTNDATLDLRLETQKTQDEGWKWKEKEIDETR